VLRYISIYIYIYIYIYPSRYMLSEDATIRRQEAWKVYGSVRANAITVIVKAIFLRKIFLRALAAWESLEHLLIVWLLASWWGLLIWSINDIQMALLRISKLSDFDKLYNIRAFQLLIFLLVFLYSFVYFRKL
jgi:hypothetical protein